MIKEDEDSVSLAPRKLPTQKRSQKRVDAILEACNLLLAEVGPDGVNTNTIAERAEIPVSSLYQYFPNKHAVLLELLRKQLREIDQASIEMSAVLKPETHWSGLSDRIIDIYIEFCESVPGFGPLWHTIQAHPDLFGSSEINNLENLEILRRLAYGYAAIHVPGKYQESELDQMLYTTIGSVIPLISRAARASEEEKLKLSKDAKMIARGYLDQFLP